MPKRNSTNMPDGFEPPVLAWAADWTDKTKSLTTVVFAVQGDSPTALKAWADSALYNVEFAPELVDLAQYTDLEGMTNTVYVAYWRDGDHDKWWSNPLVSNWWQSDDRLDDGVGYWRERYDMPIERLETLHSTQNSHGVASLAPELEGPVDEHAYPGAARDRIEISGSQDLSSPATIATTKLQSQVSSSGKRILVTPPEKMCVIRSGQDWWHCDTEERDFYLNEVHPSLIEGMDYLSRNPEESRCMSMRLMQHIDGDGGKQSQTFGLGYALDILAFEEWAKSHPTHLKIFGTFMVHAGNFGENMKLRLWHEVSVLDDKGGQFEYINCHSKTGLLPYC